MKKILFVGAEVMPFAATGGLGDVMGSLPASIARADAETDVRVVMPLYGAIGEDWRAQMEDVVTFELWLSWRRLYCGVKCIKRDNVMYYFVDNEYYFKREGLYGHYDDGERYAYFCMAVLEMLGHIGFYPDILHANDWHSALSVIYLKRLFQTRQGYAGIKTVFTIHNIEYQGKYDFRILGDVFGLAEDAHGMLEYDGCINLMKGAIVCADRVSTVSPRYAEEICTAEYAHGLEYIIRAERSKLRGILNGIDYDYYNPETDADIPFDFSSESLSEKGKNKVALQEECVLSVSKDTLVIAIVSRLASHKGLDLVVEIAERVLSERDVQLIVLGQGEGRYEQFFRELEKRFPGKMRALICYDRALSKKVYAAADVFVMPSKSEPCGLSQMIASRYGAVPVVRETGGLYDSIKPYREEAGEIFGNGFTFADYSAKVLWGSLLAAESLYRRSDAWSRLVRTVMTTDFSWSASAKKYLEMYQEI